ncbi:MAG: hypothetical protein K6D91_05865 [Prevotella sp.]|nr:hypothetical protein [Prevotella sp.]
MERLLAALMGKVEKHQVERKKKRVYRAIEIAIDNASDEIERIEDAKKKVVGTIGEANDVNHVLVTLCNLIGDQEDQEAIIKRLEKCKEYLTQDVETEGEGE